MQLGKYEVHHALNEPRLKVPQYSLLPLYRAVIVMLDEFDASKLPGLKELDGFINLHKGAQTHTVLIARTGAEEGLSAPISFESLRSHSFPLQRSDFVRPYVDVIRVSIAVAVKFIASLEQREQLAFSKPVKKHFLDDTLHPPAPEGFEENYQICCSPDAWADANIAAAEMHGYDNINETQASIRRVQADLVGEKFYELEHYPVENSWKY